MSNARGGKKSKAGRGGEVRTRAKCRPPEEKTSSAHFVDKWRSIFLVAAVALLFARPFSPSESAAFGDGIPFVLLWLLLATVWAFLCARFGQVAWRLDPASVWLLLGCGWYVLAAIVNFADGQPRAVINATWDWLGILLVFFILRELVRSGPEKRAFLVAGIGLALGLAAYGLYQYVYELPRLRADFLRDPEAMLSRAGVYLKPGTREWTVFVNRLRSTEPLATFALANSLAGFLVGWLVIGLAVFVQTVLGLQRQSTVALGGAGEPAAGLSTKRVTASEKSSDSPKLPYRLGIFGSVVRNLSSSTRRRLSLWIDSPVFGFRPVLLTLALATIFWVLLLTKSRTAYLALLVGSTCLGLVAFRRWAWQGGQGSEPGSGSTNLGQSLSRWTNIAFWIAAGLGTAIGIALLVLFLGFAAGWDWQVLSEAPKSLRYRLEYWQATIRMILDRPIFGCGAGNFQLFYTQYMLPEASEVVADPHNFLLEIVATAGLPAGCFFTAALIWLLFRPSRARSRLAPIFGEHDNSGASKSVVSKAQGKSAPGTTCATHNFSAEETPKTAFGADGVSVSAQTADRIEWLRVLVGAVAGIVLGWGLGLLTSVPPSIIPIGLAVASVILSAWVGRPWIESGRDASLIARLAAGTVLVHLSASGGISFAGIAGFLWAWLAIGDKSSSLTPDLSNRAEKGVPEGSVDSSTTPVVPITCETAVMDSDREGSPGRRDWPEGSKARGFSSSLGLLGPFVERLEQIRSKLRHYWLPALSWISTLALLALTVLCYLSAYRPVMQSRGYLLRAYRVAAEGDSREIEELFRRAAQADPLSPEPALALAQLAHYRWLEQPSHLQEAELESWLGQFVRYSGGSAKSWETAGDLYWEGWRKHRSPRWLAKAVEAYRQASVRFPTNGLVRAKLARALYASGDQVKAQAEARLALELDHLTPHADRKIPKDFRKELEDILDQTGSASGL